MDTPLDELLIHDKSCGLELQLIELVERQAQAESAGQGREAAAYQREIDRLHDELAAAADDVAQRQADPHG